jgi:hypothetical protein
LGADRRILGRSWVKLERLLGQALLFLKLPLPLRSRAGVLTGRLPFSTQLLFPEVRRDPFRCLSSCVVATVLPSTGGGSALTLCFILRQVWHTVGDSGFCGSSNPPDWLFSVSSFPPVKAGRRVPRKQRYELVWQSFLGLPPSPLLLQLF